MSVDLTLVVLAAGRARRFGGDVKPLAPVGPNGEAVLDFLAYDAISAGFDRIVLVINDSTGPVIKEHIASHWSPTVSVDFALQEHPHGTVHAVLSAAPAIDVSMPFAVSNADDLYGAQSLGLLADHLKVDNPTNALVGFRLFNTVIGDEPVTRGVCEVAEDGSLTRIDERRQLTHHSDDTYHSTDGKSPELIDAGRLVSMNLWGFGPDMWSIFQEAMSASPDASTEKEVLLPEVVDDLLHGRITQASRASRHFQVLATENRCVGVTHKGDLEIVQGDVISQIARGERPAIMPTLVATHGSTAPITTH